VDEVACTHGYCKSIVNESDFLGSNSNDAIDFYDE
jgi:hypothetical protein